MSDFIKVNFKNGEIHIVPKSSIRLLDLSIHYADNYHVIDATAQIHYNETSGCYSIYHPHYERTSISKEEYDRLCKELGVKIENNGLDCFHDYKLGDNRCAKCGILYNGIMDDMSFEEAKQIAITRVTDALKRTGLVKELGVE